MDSIGSRIKKLIKNSGLSTHNAATYIGLTQSSLSRIVNNKQEPGASTLIKIADYFGVSADWLLTGREPGQKQGGTQIIGVNSGNAGQFQNINGGLSLNYNIGLEDLKQEERERDEIIELAGKLNPQQRKKLLQLIKIAMDIEV